MTVKGRWEKLNGFEKVATSVVAMGTIIGLCFGAWFAITSAIAEEAATRQMQVDDLRLQDKADDVEFEIYKVTVQMDDIETRHANNVRYHGDEQRLKQLQRQLDILLNRQENVLERLEEKVK